MSQAAYILRQVPTCAGLGCGANPLSEKCKSDPRQEAHAQRFDRSSPVCEACESGSVDGPESNSELSL